jgi:catechol 2,3-dioxygenase-like lactoylglutathione lyase family enzyme
MSEPLNSVGAITMFVEDRDRAKSFYESVFDVELVYEDEVSVAFTFGSLIVNLLVASEAPGLIGPADTDAVCAELARRGVELLNGPIDRPWGVRTAAFADPDGHVWEVAAKIAP